MFCFKKNKDKKKNLINTNELLKNIVHSLFILKAVNEKIIDGMNIKMMKFEKKMIIFEKAKFKKQIENSVAEDNEYKNIIVEINDLLKKLDDISNDNMLNNLIEKSKLNYSCRRPIEVKFETPKNELKTTDRLEDLLKPINSQEKNNFSKRKLIDKKILSQINKDIKNNNLNISKDSIKILESADNKTIESSFYKITSNRSIKKSNTPKQSDLDVLECEQVLPSLITFDNSNYSADSKNNKKKCRNKNFSEFLKSSSKVNKYLWNSEEKNSLENENNKKSCFNKVINLNTSRILENINNNNNNSNNTVNLNNNSFNNKKMRNIINDNENLQKNLKNFIYNNDGNYCDNTIFQNSTKNEIEKNNNLEEINTNNKFKNNFKIENEFVCDTERNCHQNSLKYENENEIISNTNINTNKACENKSLQKSDIKDNNSFPHSIKNENKNKNVEENINNNKLLPNFNSERNNNKNNVLNNTKIEYNSDRNNNKKYISNMKNEIKTDNENTERINFDFQIENENISIPSENDKKISEKIRETNLINVSNIESKINSNKKANSKLEEKLKNLFCQEKKPQNLNKIKPNNSNLNENDSAIYDIYPNTAIRENCKLPNLELSQRENLFLTNNFLTTCSNNKNKAKRKFSTLKETIDFEKTNNKINTFELTFFQEKKVIKSILKKENINYDETFYEGNYGKINQVKFILHAEWWRNWCDYVSFYKTSGDEEDEKKYTLYQRPELLCNSNSKSIPLNLVQLKKDLLENIDYVPVSKKVFYYLKKWYGVDYEIVRFLKKDPFEDKIIIDLYPEGHMRLISTISERENQYNTVSSNTIKSVRNKQSNNNSIEEDELSEKRKSTTIDNDGKSSKFSINITNKYHRKTKSFTVKKNDKNCNVQ